MIDINIKSNKNEIVIEKCDGFMFRLRNGNYLSEPFRDYKIINDSSFIKILKLEKFNIQIYKWIKLDGLYGWGVINSFGDTIIPPYFTDIIPYKECYFLVLNTVEVDFDEKSKVWGLYDIFGNEILLPMWESISSITYHNQLFFITYLTDFVKYKGLSGEYFVTEKKYSLFDQYGNAYIIKNIQTGNGYEQAFKCKFKDKYMVFSSSNDIIIPPLYDEIENIGYKYGWFKIKKNNFWGIWGDNKEICPPIYEEIIYEDLYLSYPTDNYNSIFQEHNLNTIKIKHENKFGTIDRVGNLIEPQYEDIEIFNEDYIAIKMHNKWGIINCNKEIIIQPQYEKIDYCDDVFIVQKGGLYGCINAKNEITIPLIYDVILDDSNYYNVLWAKKKNKIYELELNGTIVSESTFIKDFSLGYNDLEIVLEHDSNNINLFTDIEHINVSEF